jgi:hypothetical protein
MYKVLLITRPNHDITTRYLSSWSSKIIDIASRKGVKVLDLKGSRANSLELTKMIKRQEPLLIVLNGHGNPSTVTGCDNKPLITVTDNAGLLKDRVVYALSAVPLENWV